MMKKKLKIIVPLFLLISLIAGFFIIPDLMEPRDYFTEEESFQINHYESYIFEDMKDLKITEEWLKTSSTPNKYETSFSDAEKKLLIRSSSNGVDETIAFRYYFDKSDKRIKTLIYDIKKGNSEISKRFHVNLYPTNEYLNAKIAQLRANLTMDYSKSSYFEKLIGKWKHLITNNKLIAEELNDIGKSLKQHLEDKNGRLLDIE